MSDLFISEYAEGSGGGDKYIEIYNPTTETKDLNNYGVMVNFNGGPTHYWFTFETDAQISPGDVYVVSRPNANDDITTIANETTTIFNYNGNDTVALVKIPSVGAFDNYLDGVSILSGYVQPIKNNIIDVIGDFTNFYWSVAGISQATKDKTLVRKSTVTSGNTNWVQSRGTNADDSEWEVYDKNTWDYVGSHTMDGPSTPSTPSTILPICFSKGTIVSTDQGNVEIQNIVPGKHTIGEKAICHITKTISPEKKIVCVKKNAFGKNKPNKAITMSGNHCIQCEKGAMVKAKDLVASNRNMKFVEYNQEPLYNVLMEDHNVIKVQNLEVETLDPENIVAKIHNSLMDKSTLAKLVKQMNEGILENNREKYLIAEETLRKGC